MIKSLKYICFVVLFVSCSSGIKQPENAEKDSNSSLPTYDVLSTPLYDTLTYNNLIESVKYITLETTPKAMLSSYRLFAHKYDNYYIVTSGIYEQLKISIFDDNGSYITDGYTQGRGRFETPLPYTFTIDEYNGNIIIDGYSKVLVFDINTLKTQEYSLSQFEGDQIYYLYPLTTNSYVGLGVPIMDEKMDKANYPYAYIMDSIFNVKSVLSYPNAEKRHVIMFQSETLYGTTYERWQCSQTENGLLFLQRFNDTIFFINTEAQQTPSFVIERGDKYRPSFENQKKKYLESLKKICFNGVFESNDYLFLTYKSDTTWYKTVMWSKSNPNILCKSGMQDAIPVSFDGFSGTVNVKQVQHGNTIIAAIPANQLLHVLPNLKEDDNPVVVEIKLRDNYSPKK